MIHLLLSKFCWERKTGSFEIWRTRGFIWVLGARYLFLKKTMSCRGMIAQFQQKEILY